MAPFLFLHVANGTCTTGTIQAAGIPGIVSIWSDPLYEGPVPGDVDDDALCEIRRRYRRRAMGPERLRVALGSRESPDEARMK
jgi:hypothetical protein